MRVSNIIPTTPSSVPRIGNRRYFPVRLMMRPLMMEVSNSPPIRGDELQTGLRRRGVFYHL